MITLDRKSLKATLEIMIVVLGLARFVGDTFRFKKLDAISFAFGVSPLPLVFSDREGVEDFAHQTKILILDNNQEKVEKYFDKKAFQNLTGSQSRVAIYSIALTYSPRFPELLWRNAIQKGFCNNGALAQSLELKSEIKKATVLTTHLIDPNKTWSFNIECD